MHQPSPYLIAICQQLEHQLGLKINNIAMAQKCSDLLAAEKLHISMHTIARIYGVIKPFRTPYKDTLNILARYLKYIDWEDFCSNQTNVPFDPNYFLTETSDGFSLAILQLALANEDFNALQLILEKAKKNENEAILFTAAELIGAYVRESKKQKELLQLLADSSIGHFFFYECYVDEDNENNYFSEALVNYYLPNVTNEYRKLFVYSFIISQTAHKEGTLSSYHSDFLALIGNLDKNECHFHELSRWFECLILIDGFKGELIKTWKHHVNEIVVICNNYEDAKKAWFISRVLKALLLFDLRNELFVHTEFNAIVDHLIKNQKKEVHSIALYSIQLYWISKSFFLKNKSIYSPFRIHSLLFQNESHTKAALEFASAALFASGENKTIITNNLKQFCERKGVIWVLKLIN